MWNTGPSRPRQQFLKVNQTLHDIYTFCGIKKIPNEKPSSFLAWQISSHRKWSTVGNSTNVSIKTHTHVEFVWLRL